MEIIQHTPNIWTVRGFMSPEECQSMIETSEAIGYEEADISFKEGAKMVKSWRDNYRAQLVSESIAEDWWNRAKLCCPSELDGCVPSGVNERFRFYRYSGGQKFKRHMDGRVELNHFEESRITLMVYLNDDYEGGETTFNDVTIKPEAGMALFFIHEEKHAGNPVTSGTKYAMRTDVFYRKNEFEPGERVQIKAAVLEFNVEGNTIWVQGPDGATIFRLKCSGKINVDRCQNSPFSHADAQVEGDIDFCVSQDLVE